MILASAIKFHINATDKDVVLCASRHGDIWEQLDALGFEPKKGYEELEQGFIDHNNNFLTREEAYEHAKMCGQVCQKVIYDRDVKGLFGKKMISEDLW